MAYIRRQVSSVLKQSLQQRGDISRNMAYIRWQVSSVLKQSLQQRGDKNVKVPMKANELQLNPDKSEPIWIAVTAT